MPVSYTHLDVYKRQEKDTAKSTMIGVTDRVNNLIVVKSGVSNGEKIVAKGVGQLTPFILYTSRCV